MQTFLILSENQDFIDQTLNKFILKNSVSMFDILDFKSAEKIGIDDIREIIRQSIKYPFKGKYKITVIRNFEFSTIEAQNSILKFLEEQPEFLTIFLISKNSQNILPTVLSRTQILKTRKIKPQEKLDLEILINGSISEKLNYIQNNITTKEHARIFIVNLLETLEYYLLNLDDLNKSELTRKNLADYINKTEKAKTFIENNLNFKHVLDILLIGFRESP